MTAKEVIDLLGLEPLGGEGGFFRETYRSGESISCGVLPERYGGSRTFATAIYYLIERDSPSLMHRVKSDEIFHFYLGDPVKMLQLHPDGRGEIITIGSNISGGESLQVVVPSGVWQGSMLIDGGEWALMGTTVAPGFEFDDFELAHRDHLLPKYPAYEDIIGRLTKP